MKNIEERRDSNVCGVVGLCTSLFIPLAGLILGIIALSRREKTKLFGVLAIIISIVSWIVSALIFVGMFSAIST